MIFITDFVSAEHAWTLTESADRITDLASTENAQTNWVSQQNENKERVQKAAVKVMIKHRYENYEKAHENSLW